MGILDAPALDAVYNKPVNALHPPRDLPNLAAWFDASDITTADGTVTQIWRDKSGNGQDVTQPTASLAPTVQTTGGKRYLHFGATSYLQNQLFGRGGGGNGWQQPASYPQPVTVLAVARIGSSVSAVNRWLVSSSGSGNWKWGPSNVYDTMWLNCGTNSGSAGGLPVNDDTWHVLGTIASVGPSQFLDGSLVRASPTQDQSTGALVGLGICAMQDGTLPMQNCDVREVIIVGGALTLKQVDQVAAYLGAKW